jgi:hypothetical protein
MTTPIPKDRIMSADPLNIPDRGAQAKSLVETIHSAVEFLVSGPRGGSLQRVSTKVIETAVLDLASLASLPAHPDPDVMSEAVRLIELNEAGRRKSNDSLIAVLRERLAGLPVAPQSNADDVHPDGTALSLHATLTESECSYAARFARLYGIVRRLRWTDYGVPALAEDKGSAQALIDLCEFLFADGMDAAIARMDAADLNKKGIGYD